MAAKLKLLARVCIAIAVASSVTSLAPNAADAQSLKGAERETFLSKAFDGCMSAYGPGNTTRIPKPLVEKYCHCLSTGIASSLTAAEIKAEDPKVTKPVIKTVGGRCYAQMEAEALR